MGLLVLTLTVAIVVFVVLRRRRYESELADARDEALRWYGRLGAQLAEVSTEDVAIRQALADAAERHRGAGRRLDRAATVGDYEAARDMAVEGLAYARAARAALGLDPGPEPPALVGQRSAGVLTKERAVEVRGHHYRAGPRATPQTPHYYPGGSVAGRGVPAGWYSEPWWRAALESGAWGLGTVLVYDALFSHAWGDDGHGLDLGGTDPGNA